MATGSGLSWAAFMSASNPAASVAVTDRDSEPPTQVILTLSDSEGGTDQASAHGQERQTISDDRNSHGKPLLGAPLSGAVSAAKRRKVLHWLKHAQADTLSELIPEFATLARAAGISERVQKQNPRTPGVHQRCRTPTKPDIQGRIVTVT